LAKKKVEKPRREPTKRQLSRWQQQERRRRLILGVGIAIIVTVLGVIGGGVYTQWYVGEYKPLHEVLIEVNDTQFDMDYYIKMLDYYYRASQIEPQQLTTFTDEVVEIIEQNELIRQEAMKLGISVSDEEVDEEFRSHDLPVSEDYRDVVRTQLLVDRLLDEYFDEQVPTYAEQRYILAMFLESERQANEVRDRIEAGEDFTTLAGELSLDDTSREKEGDFGWHPEGILPLLLENSIVEEYAFSAEAGVLSQPIYDESRMKPVGYWLIKVLERDDEARGANVKVILLGTGQEANEVRARLEAGEDFATLAVELSLHGTSKADGGDFAVSEGIMSEAFDEFVFSAELDVLSQPIRDDTQSTQGGYWLVEVTDIDDNRQLADEDRDLLKVEALSEWVAGLLDDPDNKVENYLTEGRKLFAISHILGY
jgi:parvulin-like peptidyl-prolyl isomerase